MSKQTGNAVSAPLTGMDVVILAGGLGTRIQSVLGDTPKLLAPVGARPVLDWLIERLARQGADRIVLALGRGAEQVIGHLPSLVGKPSEQSWPTIVPLVEPAQLGTAGAIRYIRPHLRPGPAIIMNGDTLTDGDLRALEAKRRASDADAVLLCVTVPDSGRFGRVQLTQGGRIDRFLEKDPEAGPGLISAGVYALSARMLDRIAASLATSLERDFFQQAAPGTLDVLVSDGRFVDVGTPDGLQEAQAIFGS